MSLQNEQNATANAHVSPPHVTFHSSPSLHRSTRLTVTQLQQALHSGGLTQTDSDTPQLPAPAKKASQRVDPGIQATLQQLQKQASGLLNVSRQTEDPPIDLDTLHLDLYKHPLDEKMAATETHCPMLLHGTHGGLLLKLIQKLDHNFPNGERATPTPHKKCYETLAELCLVARQSKKPQVKKELLWVFNQFVAPLLNEIETLEFIAKKLSYMALPIGATINFQNHPYQIREAIKAPLIAYHLVEQTPGTPNHLIVLSGTSPNLPGLRIQDKHHQKEHAAQGYSADFDRNGIGKTAYESCRDTLLSWIPPTDTAILTGHSLGGTLALRILTDLHLQKHPEGKVLTTIFDAPGVDATTARQYTPENPQDAFPCMAFSSKIDFIPTVGIKQMYVGKEYVLPATQGALPIPTHTEPQQCRAKLNGKSERTFVSSASRTSAVTTTLRLALPLSPTPSPTKMVVARGYSDVRLLSPSKGTEAPDYIQFTEGLFINLFEHLCLEANHQEESVVHQQKPPVHHRILDKTAETLAQLHEKFKHINQNPKEDTPNKRKDLFYLLTTLDHLLTPLSQSDATTTQGKITFGNKKAQIAPYITFLSRIRPGETLV